MDKLFKCLMLQLFCVLNINGQVILPRDVIINEILFNPVKDGFDYIELYNRTETHLDIGNLLIANRNSAGEISSVKSISKESRTIASGTHVIITTNMDWLKQHYTVPDSADIIQIASLPFLPDDEGCVLILRKSDSMIIDELQYEESWHFKMIKDPEAVALERIDIESPTQDKNNWTSASSSSGGGTPGYINSQARSTDLDVEGVSVQPEVFSPDNDGHNDFASITISSAEQGKIVNAIIFNAMGRAVRYLLKNEILGLNNKFTWDGYDDRDQLLPSGIYIVFTQVFDTKGFVRKYRSSIVLDSFPP